MGGQRGIKIVISEQDLDSNAYFPSGGIYIHTSRDTIWRPGNAEQPEPWTCHYCGALNPGDTWKCSRCPAPRSEETRERESTWQPPTRIISHVEEPHLELPPLPSKPSVPWWIAILTISLFIFSSVTGIGIYLAIFLTGNPLSIVLWTAAFVVCFYAFSKLRGVVRDQYDYETINWGIG